MSELMMQQGTLDSGVRGLISAASAILGQAEQEGDLWLMEVCVRVEHNLSLFEQRPQALEARTVGHFARFAELARAYLGNPGDDTVSALIEFLKQPGWLEPLSEADELMLRSIAHVDSQVVHVDLNGQAKNGHAGGGYAGSRHGTTVDHDAELSVRVLESAAVELDTAFSTDAGDEKQLVSKDLIRLLADETLSMRQSLGKLLSDAIGPKASTSECETAFESYCEQVRRLSEASTGIGLTALGTLLSELSQLLQTTGGNAVSPQLGDVLKLLPGGVLSYLGAPNDPSACEGLIDLLRSDVWGTPMSDNNAVSLALRLASVEVTLTTNEMAPRQRHASEDDVSLALPEDVRPELLDGLLQELPIQTAEFSAAIERIVAGQGSMEEVNTAQRAAHTLKGAANTVGINGIGNLTHQLEDILIALTRHQALPNRALGDTLVHAADCLETMSEAVMGTGPVPKQSLEVYQDVLDWANRIDADGVQQDAGITVAEGPATPEGGRARERETGGGRTSTHEVGPQRHASETIPGQATTKMMRVPVSLIEELLRLVSETIVSTGQIRDRVHRTVKEVQAIREQNRTFIQLATEFENLVDLRGVGAAFSSQRRHAEFDPLEFEHYSELHTMSRRLIEAATDAGEMGVRVDENLAALGDLVDVHERLHMETQGAVMRSRMVPVSTVTSRLQRSVRQACRLLDKQVNLSVSGSDTLIDNNVLNELVDPLMHMLRNAVDHGIEEPARRSRAGKPGEGRIDLKFAREGNHILVRCTDDGAGLDLAIIRQSALDRGLIDAEQVLSDDELARLILLPGFSTRTDVSQISGRGIGMDVVNSRVLDMKGSLQLHNTPGEGLLIELRLPAAMISTHALLTRLNNNPLALSSHGVQDVQYASGDDITIVGDQQVYRVGDAFVPLLDLHRLLELPLDLTGRPKDGFPVLLVRLDSGALRAVRVPPLTDSLDLVVKSFGRFVPKTLGVVGAAVLGDGSVTAVLDLPDLLRDRSQVVADAVVRDLATTHEQYNKEASQHTALVVDDSLTARRATAQFMREAGFEVRTAVDGMEAVNILEKWAPDILLVDMEMPRMNGLELTAHVRGRKDFADVPIVMITSRSTEKHKRQAQTAGVSVYLTKPFSEDELLKRVMELTT